MLKKKQDFNEDQDYSQLFNKHKYYINSYIKPKWDDAKKSNNVRRSKSNLLQKIVGKESSKRSKITVMSDPDNGIVFLQDGSRYFNPQNAKTPPAPMWGEEIEEDKYDNSQPFYNHSSAVGEQQKRRQKSFKMISKYGGESSSYIRSRQLNRPDIKADPYNNL
jgi:hypothetical protein